MLEAIPSPKRDPPHAGAQAESCFPFLVYLGLFAFLLVCSSFLGGARFGVYKGDTYWEVAPGALISNTSSAGKWDPSVAACRPQTHETAGPCPKALTHGAESRTGSITAAGVASLTQFDAVPGTCRQYPESLQPNNKRI